MKNTRGVTEWFGWRLPSLRDWWFLNRPWASAGTYHGGTGAPGSQRRAYLRASLLRVTVEISFPWSRKP